MVTDLDEAAEKIEGETEADAAAAAEKEASFFIRQSGESSTAYAARIFHRVFCFDIERVIGMTVSPPASGCWNTEEPPAMSKQTCTPSGICCGLASFRVPQPSCKGWVGVASIAQVLPCAFRPS